MIPNIIIYIAIMLAFVIIWFVWGKRPVYEALFLSFLLLLCITKTWKNVFNYINGALNISLIYSMIVFVALAQLLTYTKVIDSCIYLILSVLGRVTGGAGYASVIASSFMGSLSGSGPGNVMTTGVITIPAMKKSGFPPELAANVESVSSCMGNMIPPSSNIVGALGAYMTLYPNSEITTGCFWIILWGIAIYFIIQRLVIVWAFCKYYKVKPIDKKDIPSFKEMIRNGWKGLMLPIIILAPFIFDSICNDFMIRRLGIEGANIFSKSLLFFIAGVAALYTLLVTADKKSVSFSKIVNLFSSKMRILVSPISACIFGYMISELFADIDVTTQINEFLESLNMSRIELSLFIPILTLFLGMVIPGFSQVVIFGPAFITAFASTGANPLLIAAMLPCMCGTTCGITPPLAHCMYSGMFIAESDFKKTLLNDFWWIAAHFLLEVIMLMGFLPIIGI